jgi:hypothetical protein
LPQGGAKGARADFEALDHDAGGHHCHHHRLCRNECPRACSRRPPAFEPWVHCVVGSDGRDYAHHYRVE